jgi:signal transduction histidine kinase/DNA-binding response OmpR family regulator
VRILLIDDSAAYHEEFAELLGAGAFADAVLDYVSDAAEGARTMNRGAHDIYFVDYRLPGERGTDLIRRARETGLLQPIICLTGFDSPQLDLEAEQAGADGYLGKGAFSATMLSRKIRFAISSARRPRMPSDAENRFRLAQDTANIGTWHWDIANRTLIWDDHMYHLHGCDPSTGVPAYEVCRRVLRPQTLRDIEQALRACAESDKPFRADLDVTWDDGSLHYMRSAGRAVRGAGGRTTRVTGITWDITELRHLVAELAQARDEADRANKAKSNFLAGMSHELRTPLNAVLGYAELLHMEGGLSATQAARVQTMLAAGNHLLVMINRVLDMSEIEAGHVDLQATLIDVQAMAAECLDLVRAQAMARGLALSLAVTPGAPRELVTDATRLRQILLNLLGNAVKFTARGGITVHLRMAAEGGALRIEVADTGPGVPPDQRARLFHDFVRLDNGETCAAEGVGLGLALSARLATLLGGRLEHCDNPGGGSVFWLELPAHGVAPAPAAAPCTAEPATPPPPRGLRVLVVDDTDMNCDIAAAFLRGAGHGVTCASSGAEAIALVGAQPARAFDVVLMDVRMPGMDGLEAARRIRALGDGRGDVPIIALTALAFAENVQECHDTGMDGHLAKPFTPAGLQACVAKAAGLRRRMEACS